MFNFKNSILERFLPLIAVFSLVIAGTVLISAIFTGFEPMNLGRAFMGVFFLVFGGFKVYNLEGFKEAFKMYDIIAEKSNLYATAYPFIELALGISFISLLFLNFQVLEIITLVSTVFVMGLGAFGVLNALREGRDLKCACLGNVFNVPMTTVTLIEDLGMAFMALVMLFIIV